MSRDPEQEYFSDGLAEEIINLLAHIPGLKRHRAHVFLRLPRQGAGHHARSPRRSASGRFSKAASGGGQPHPRDRAVDQRRGRLSPLVPSATTVSSSTCSPIQDEIAQAIADALAVARSSSHPTRHTPAFPVYRSVALRRGITRELYLPEAHARAKEY